MKIQEIFKTSNSPEEAQQKVESLKKEQEKLQNRISELDVETQTIENEAGEAALQDSLEGTSSSGAIRRKLWNKEKERESKQQALQKIQGYISRAEKEVTLARAKQKRKEAEQLRKQAEKHETRTNELLKQLSEHEGCEYVPYKPATAPGVYADAKSYKIPHSQALKEQAAALENEASHLERHAQGAKQPYGAAV
jgi:chromosome segregation ATPase